MKTKINCLIPWWISRAELLKWWTAVWIRTFWWWLADLVSLSKVYYTLKSVYPKILRFWPFF